MKGVVLAFTAAATVITVRAIKTEHRAPVPGEFLLPGALFAAIAVVGEIPSASTAASWAAWGLVLATVVAKPETLQIPAGLLPRPPGTPGGSGKSGFTKGQGSSGGGSGGGGGGSW